MAEELLSYFRTDIKSLELIPGAGGCFEISVDDDAIFSKLKSGRYPEARDIIKSISAAQA